MSFCLVLREDAAYSPTQHIKGFTHPRKVFNTNMLGKVTTLQENFQGDWKTKSKQSGFFLSSRMKTDQSRRSVTWQHFLLKAKLNPTHRFGFGSFANGWWRDWSANFILVIRSSVHLPINRWHPFFRIGTNVWCQFPNLLTRLIPSKFCCPSVLLHLLHAHL